MADPHIGIIISLYLLSKTFLKENMIFLEKKLKLEMLTENNQNL